MFCEWPHCTGQETGAQKTRSLPAVTLAFPDPIQGFPTRWTPSFAWVLKLLSGNRGNIPGLGPFYLLEQMKRVLGFFILPLSLGRFSSSASACQISSFFLTPWASGFQAMDIFCSFTPLPCFIRDLGWVRLQSFLSVLTSQKSRL